MWSLFSSSPGPLRPEPDLFRVLLTNSLLTNLLFKKPIEDAHTLNLVLRLFYCWSYKDDKGVNKGVLCLFHIIFLDRQQVFILNTGFELLPFQYDHVYLIWQILLIKILHFQDVTDL